MHCPSGDRYDPESHRWQCVLLHKSQLVNVLEHNEHEKEVVRKNPDIHEIHKDVVWLQV